MFRTMEKKYSTGFPPHGKAFGVVKLNARVETVQLYQPSQTREPKYLRTLTRNSEDEKTITLHHDHVSYYYISTSEMGSIKNALRRIYSPMLSDVKQRKMQPCA